MLLLSGREVRRALPMGAAIDAVEKAYVAFSAGRSLTPMRTQLRMPTGTTLTMPAYLTCENTPGVKIVSVFTDNPTRNLPVITGLMILLDGETGLPAAAMDAASLTAIRTGASGGVAAHHLARKDTQVAAVIGAGVQGRTQLAALCEVRDVRRVRVFDVRRSSAMAFVEDMSQSLEAEWIVVDTPEDAVRGADVVLCATTSSVPVFAASALSSGVHITGVGSYTPEMAELGVDLLLGADRVVVDSRDACWEEAGDFIQPLSRGKIGRDVIDAEIGEVAAGSVRGRTSPAEVTVFKAVGLALLDVAVARAALARAKEAKIGREIDLSD